MSDILRNKNDFALVNGDLSVIEDSQSVVQEVVERLQSFAFEWFLDNEGLPYFEELTGKIRNISYIKTIIMKFITDTRGVSELLKLDIIYNTETRTFTLDIVIKTIYNENRSIKVDNFGIIDKAS